MNLTDRVAISILIFTFFASAQCEFITLGVAGALGGLGYYVYDKYKCVYQECCTDEYIHPDLDSKCESRIPSRRKKGLDSYLH